MNKKCKLVPFPLSEISDKKRIAKKIIEKKPNSPSPKINPFLQFKSLEKLPRLRPTSPTFEKLPKTSRKFLVAFSIPSTSISLKILPKTLRFTSPPIRPLGTPTFLNSD